MQIANILINNNDIKTILEVKEGREILFNYIYPYLYIPGIEETAKCMICFELNTPRIDRNEYFKHSELFIRILCHRDVMETDFGGTKTDILEGVLIRALNWSNDLGSTIKLQFSRGIVFTDTYYAREIKFTDLKYNGFACIDPCEPCDGCE